jgi:hypothetical protein
VATKSPAVSTGAFERESPAASPTATVFQARAGTQWSGDNLRDFKLVAGKVVEVPDDDADPDEADMP